MKRSVSYKSVSIHTFESSKQHLHNQIGALKNKFADHLLKNSEVWLIALSALAIRFLLMGLADETDSDAVSRAFTSWEWAGHPVWYKTSVWAPFHYYLTGSGFMIWKDLILLPVILNILLSVMLIFPFYYFVKREYNRAGAIFATIFLTFSPLMLRLGFLNLAEIPGLLFLILTMNLISKGVRESKSGYLLLSGLTMTLAAGFRYESWLLILLFTLMLVIGSGWRSALMFFATAMVFPVIWMIQNKLATGDFLFGFHANTEFTHKALGINDHVDFEAYLRRTWFFPFSWLIAVGPIVAWLILKQLPFEIRKLRTCAFPQLWVIPMMVYLMVVLYNAISGNLLLHHRFTATLLVLSLPLIASVMKDTGKKNIRLAAISLALTIGLSFVYTIGGISPVPRLKNQSAKQFPKIIYPESGPGSGLVVDFTNWEDTWYIGLHSGFVPSKILMLGGEKQPSLPSERIREMLLSSDKVIFLIKDDSPLFRFVQDQTGSDFKIYNLFKEGNISVVKYVPK